MRLLVVAEQALGNKSALQATNCQKLFFLFFFEKAHQVLPKTECPGHAGSTSPVCVDSHHMFSLARPRNGETDQRHDFPGRFV